MRIIIGTAAAVALAALLPHVASAQDAQTQSQQTQSVRAQVKQQLKKAGFSDVRVMPESFLVRAKDPSGNPVMMVINPDSFTAVTEVPESDQTTGTKGFERIPGHKNGMVAELKEDYKSNLTTAQKKEIWQTLNSEGTRTSSSPTNFKPQVGSIIPSAIAIQPLPNDATTKAPALSGYEYAMVQNEVLIVSPNSRKIVDIIKQQ